MKKFNLLWSVCIGSVVYLTLTSKITGSHPGSTGAPREHTCSTQLGCHPDAVNVNDASNVQLVVKNGPHYSADAVLELTLTVEDMTSSRFGFQILALSEKDQPIGTWLITDSARTWLQTGGMDGRTYVTHKQKGTPAPRSGVGTWTFNWKAPAADSGKITFYYACNATNSDATHFGDKIYTQKSSITWKGGSTAQNEITTAPSIQWSQTEALLMVRGLPSFSGPLELSVWGLDGTLLESKVVEENTGTLVYELTDRLRHQLVILQIQHQQQVITSKVLAIH